MSPAGLLVALLLVGGMSEPSYKPFAVAEGPKRLRCKSNVSGGNYMGDVNKSRSNRTCQRWASQTPHGHAVTAAMLPDDSLGDAENFCRSPDFDRHGPWCYTTDPNTTWEYCDVPTCREISCRDSEAGADYIGGVGQTTTAHACKVWKDVKIPTSYAYKEYGRIEMPDGSLSNADCRNPVGRRLRPWCHSTNPDLEGEDAWEYCDVPLCERQFNRSNTTEVLPEKRCQSQGGQCARSSCCPNNHYVGGLCGDATRVCCLQPPDCDWDHPTKGVVQWPRGSYSIPMTFFGCPKNGGAKWVEGKIRLVSTSVNILGNETSDLLRLKGPRTIRDVTIGICSHDDRFEHTSSDWLPGSYCLVQYGDLCPTDFIQRTVTIQSAAVNMWTGSVANASCDGGRLCLFFCCRDDGVITQPLVLPTSVPFYLLKLGDKCQSIDRMYARDEYLQLNMGPDHVITIPTNDTPSSVKMTPEGISLQLCYYETTDADTCYNEADDGFFYRGNANTTSMGMCDSWDWASHIDYQKLYEYVGLDDTSFCRNTLVLESEQRPWCYVRGTKVLCGVPSCAYTWDDYKQIGVGRPARQSMHDAQAAQGIVDGIQATCSTQLLRDAWWQVNLQGWYSIVAVQIFQVKFIICGVRLANIYVGFEADDFQSFGSFVCARNISLGASTNGILRCTQAVKGQYVTLANLVYRRYETYTSPYEECLHLCEVTVYVEETTCGRLLLEMSQANTIQPYVVDSFNQQMIPASAYTLNNAVSWCGTTGQQQMWIKVELLFPRRLQGLQMQGTQDGNAMVTKVSLHHGFQDSLLVPYRDSRGSTLVFENNVTVLEPQVHVFPREISASILRIDVLDFFHKPCMRFDLVGCMGEFSNLVNSTSADQVSQRTDKAASLAVDGKVATCSETLVENASWWAAEMADDFRLHTVVLQTAIAFPWNLAVRRRGIASSVGWSGDEWRAVDGNTNGMYWDGSCSSTRGELKPWWAVELDKESLVSTVYITNRLDCCETRLNQFSILVGNLPPTPELNRTSFGLCKYHNRYFNIGETRRVDCDQPQYGRYVVIVLHWDSESGVMFLNPCEVQVYGDRVPFIVGKTTDPPPGALPDARQSCTLHSPVPSGGLVHSYNCPRHLNGKYFVTSAEGRGPLGLCSVLVYGGHPGRLEPGSTNNGNFVYVTCDGDTQIHIHWDVEPDESDLKIAKAQLETVMHYCEGSQKCQIPLPPSTGSSALLYVTVTCSMLESRHEACHRVISTEDVIQTPNYPSYYGLDFQCEWAVHAAPNHFVALNMTSFRLADSVESYRDGCLEVNQGVCRDEAVVHYGGGPGGEGADGVALRVHRPSLFISHAPSLTLRVTSCYRNLQLKGEGSQKLGLQASISFQECGGCQVQSSGLAFECVGTCGQILSRGYPHGYSNSERTEWNIRVESDRYISLVFKDFDVFEKPLQECKKDFVEVIDVDLIKELTSFGRFCNSERPPTDLRSSWSQLRLVFVTDVTNIGRGFHALYRQQKYQLSANFPTYGKSPECHDNWTRFEGSCYALITWPRSLTWFEAEHECGQWMGHLVSIGGQLEMTFLHYMLTTQWRTLFYRTFIGLNDRDKEGKWQWSDKSPVTYTDWSRSSGYANIEQPDGAEVEDCSMIRLDSMHSTRSWHDIPCAYDQVQQFLCETSIRTNRELGRPRPILGDGNILSLDIPNGIQRCDNGELILSQFVCDGILNCADNSDETDCNTENSCLDVHFRCADGTCISMTSYCDFKMDCPDQSDEDHCVYRKCDIDEFRCNNGECIPKKNTCDLLPHCQDSSDEDDCDRCAENVAFQCFDGTCIRKDKRCDGVVDCPGSLHEDEAENCARETTEPSCLHWQLAGETTSGRYWLKPDGVDVLEAECFMADQGEFVKTIIHHDAEERIYVTGYDNPGHYVRPVDYGMTRGQLRAVMASALNCEQFVKIECYAGSGLTNDYWETLDGIKMAWTTNSNGCQCILTSNCVEENRKCACETAELVNPRVTTTDEGMLSSTDHPLPIMAISLSGTGFADSQYQYHTVGPLVCYQYANESRDEFRCSTGRWISKDLLCLADVDEYGEPIGCRDMSHLQNCQDFVCPFNYIKCPVSHCIHPRAICDKRRDCPGGEDEQDCENYECPGHYRCYGASFCVGAHERCDVSKQCPSGDDELYCDVICPEDCICTGLSFFCRKAALTAVPRQIPVSIKKLDLSYNNITFSNGSFSAYVWLGELILRSTHITNIPVGSFLSLANLYMLDLSYNDIRQIEGRTFEGLVNLRTLLLQGNNNLIKVASYAFEGLVSLPVLDLSGLGLEHLDERAFSGMVSLVKVDLSRNNLKVIENIMIDLVNIHQLNLSGNPGLEVTRGELEAVTNLVFLETDDFKYCCFVNDRVPEHQCLPERDEFSSCEDLMRRDVLKVFLWILGLMAFLLNIVVLVYRKHERLTVYSYCVMNLAVADFLMGTYMVVLASVDAFYRGVYIEYAESWIGSWLCQFLGFLNTFSSETSVFTLCVISADRFYKIVFPLHASKFDISKAKMVMGLVWFAGFTVAALPLLPIDYFGERYYGRSSVCISIYLTNERTDGWEFSVAVFHVLNFTCFTFLFVAYAYIYHIVKQSNSQTKSFTHSQKPNQSEVALVRRLTLVVFTDFICWVPINIMGLAAGAGALVPGEVYAWVVVFLLPVNSAINPLLYTISSIKVWKNKSEASQSNPTTHMNIDKATSVMAYPKSDGYKDLKSVLAQQGQLSVQTVFHLVKKTAERLDDIHSKGFFSGKMDMSTIETQGVKAGFDVAVPISMGTMATKEDDIFALGRLSANLLRRLATGR